jgi:hypothetical protein
MYTCSFVMSICNMRMSCGNIRKFSWIHSCISYAVMRGLFTSKAHTIVFWRSFVRLRLILTALHRKWVVRLVGCKQAPHYTETSSITLLHRTGPLRSAARRGMYLFKDRPATRTGPRLSATRRRARWPLKPRVMAF